MYGFSRRSGEMVRSGLIAVLLVVALWLCVAPISALAYETTKQSVTQLTPDTFLFQVTYRFSFLNRETRVPVLASRVSAVDQTLPALQYTLVSESGEVLTTGASAAIVLSDSPVVDRQYFLPDGEPGLFTLISIVQLPPEVVATGGSAKLQVSWLPFTLIREGVEQVARVPDLNLTSYHTPLTTW